MNCKNCGQIVNENEAFCSNCGSKIESNFNFSTSLVEKQNNNNAYSIRKNNNFKRKFAITFIGEILFIIVCILFFQGNNKISSALNVNEFNNKMQNLNYILKDISYQYKNASINNYYLAYNVGFNYKIEFIVVKNNNNALTLFNNAVNQINTAIGDISYGMVNVSLNDYKNYMVTSNGNFYVTIMNENTVIYCVAPEQYRSEIEKTLDNIGYMYNTKNTFNIILIILFAWGILFVSWWKIFKKAGIEGWKLFIPIYNCYCMYKIAFGSGWYFFLLLIPFVNFIIIYIMFYKLAKAFGKSNGFAWLNVFFSIFTLQILAFDDSEYMMKF